MKSLYNTIIDNNKIDGHIHLFDHTGIINNRLIDSSKRCVCFADIVFKYISEYKNEKMIEQYDNFINNYYDSSKHILLATGENAKDIIDIHKKYPNIIKGFGELKCYASYINGPLPYGNFKWIKPVLEYNMNIGLPVYIHYNLNSISAINDLTNLLKTYKFPIVLCHCGMYDNCDYLSIHNTILKLMHTFNNMYVDISYNATDFYIKNIDKLLELNSYKVILGTDINLVIERVMDNPNEIIDDLYNKFHLLQRFGNYDYNVKQLFNKLK
jgi:hypothetical protein